MDMDVDDPNDPFAEDPPTAPATSPVPPKAINFALASPSDMIPSPAPRKLFDILTVATTVPLATPVTVMLKAALKPKHMVFICAMFPVEAHKDPVRAA